MDVRVTTGMAWELGWNFFKNYYSPFGPDPEPKFLKHFLKIFRTRDYEGMPVPCSMVPEGRYFAIMAPQNLHFRQVL